MDPLKFVAVPKDDRYEKFLKEEIRKRKQFGDTEERKDLKKVRKLELLSICKNLTNITKDYTCDVCSQNFPFQFVLQQHLLTHTISAIRKPHIIPLSDLKFSCKFPGCTKRFKHQRSIKDHSATHKPSIIICDFCGLKCFTKNGLRIHILKKHIRGNTIQCRLCPKKFYDNCHLKLHLLSHRTVGQFKCTTCEKETFFKDQKTLKFHNHFVHKLNLTSQKPQQRLNGFFQCQSCPKKYKQRAAFIAHRDSQHDPEDNGSYICDCSAKFKYMKSFKKHQMKGIIRNFNCYRCDKVFSLPCMLKVHELKDHKKDSFQCNQCPEKFDLMDELKKHGQIHL